MEEASILFHLIMDTIVETYTRSQDEFYINEVVLAIKNIYVDKDLFKYIMEQYYSDNRSPFINAYNDFMNNFSCMDIEVLFYTISKGILYRLIREQRTNNEYIVY